MTEEQPGEKYPVARSIAVLSSFVPLAFICIGIQRLIDAPPDNSNEWIRGGLFVLSLLLTSFTYDTLKALLTLPPAKFMNVWLKTKRMWLSILIYIAGIVALALVPLNPSSYMDVIVNLLLVGLILASTFYATKNFVEAALSAAKG